MYEDDRMVVGLKKPVEEWKSLDKLVLEFVVKNKGPCVIDTVDLNFEYDPDMSRIIEKIPARARKSVGVMMDGSDIFELIPYLQLNYS